MQNPRNYKAINYTLVNVKNHTNKINIIEKNISQLKKDLKKIQNTNPKQTIIHIQKSLENNIASRKLNEKGEQGLKGEKENKD